MSPDRDDRGPADDEYEDAEYAEEAPRSIFATTWFRAVLVVVVLAVVGVLALPYLLDWVGPSKLSPTVKGPVVTVPSPPLGSAAAPPAGAPAAPGAATPPAGPTAQMTPAAAEPKPELPPAAAPAPAAQAPAKAARGTAPGTKPESPTKTASSDHARAMSAEPAPKTARAADGTKTAAKPAVKPAAKASAKPKAAAGGPFWVQVGAFRDESSAKALMAKLRADDFAAEEVGPSEAPAVAAEPTAPASGGGDKYDVFVSGASSDDVNAKLAGKGLSADGVAGGAVVKPSLPLRDAVALSRDLATEGMKVQVRRATPAAPEKATARAGTGGGDRLYRVRVGSFPDRGAAETARKALAAKGYPGFIARGGG